MKKQITTLMLGAAVLSASPVLAGTGKNSKDDDSSNKVRLSPLIKMSATERQEPIRKLAQEVAQKAIRDAANQKAIAEIESTGRHVECRHVYHFQNNEESNKELPYRHITIKEMRLIGQKEFSIASADDAKNKLATYGVGPCVGIGVYNPILQRVGLAHCDCVTSPQETMGPFMYQVCENTDQAQMKIFLISQDEKNISRFHSELKNMGYPDTVFTIIKTAHSSNVGIDSKDGTFFYYNYNNATHPDVDLDKRMKLTGFQMEKDTLEFIKPLSEDKKSLETIKPQQNIVNSTQDSAFPALDLTNLIR